MVAAGGRVVQTFRNAMTSIRSIAKQAKDEFIPGMEALGFEHRGGLNFVRRRCETFDLVHLVVLRSGVNLRAFARCWIQEVDPELSIEQLPRGAGAVTGGPLGRSGRFPDHGHLWPIRTSEEVSLALKEILSAVHGTAIPWFSHMNSRETFVAEVDINLKTRSNWPDVMKRLLGRT